MLNLKKPDRTRSDDRKLDHVCPYLDKAEAEGRSGVVAVVAAPEFQWVYSGQEPGHHPRYGLLRVRKRRTPRRDVDYFYIYDNGFGPGFVKICTYLPYPAKVWLLWRTPVQVHHVSARIMSRGGVAV